MADGLEVAQINRLHCGRQCWMLEGALSRSSIRAFCLASHRDGHDRRRKLLSMDDRP